MSLFVQKVGVFSLLLSESDPCARDNGGCEHSCVNENNRPVCHCYDGYQLAADRKSCRGLTYLMAHDSINQSINHSALVAELLQG